MEKQSLLVLKSKSKASPFIQSKITTMFMEHEDTADSDFIKAYKAVVIAMKTMHVSGHFTIKDKEDLLIRNIEVMGRGLDINNNAN